jgi:hypothetical protein
MTMQPAAGRLWAPATAATNAANLFHLAGLGGPSDVYHPTRVNATVAFVKGVLNGGTVWQSQVQDFSQRMAKLSPQESAATVNLLSRMQVRNSNALDLMVGEVTMRGVGAYGGLNPAQRSSLWRALVPGQDKANLARIFSAASNHNSDASKGQFFQQEFAAAIAERGTVDQKQSFVSSMTGAAIAGNTSAARAVAVVVASLKDAGQFSAALTGLGRRGVDAMVAATVGKTNNRIVADAPDRRNSMRLDTALYRTLAAGFQRSNNAREKAGFISASGAVLRQIAAAPMDGSTKRQVLKESASAMSAVIGTDVSGVIENTLLQRAGAAGASSGRDSLKAYSMALLDSGQASHLGAITMSLQRGNSLASDPMAYLGRRESRSGEAPAFANARVMGEWVGLVGSAVQTRVSERDKNAAFASLIFTGSVDVIKEGVGAVFPAFKLPAALIAAGLKPAINAGILNWRNELASKDRDFSRNFYEAALPRHKSGVEATAEWVPTLNSAFSSSVLRQ